MSYRNEIERSGSKRWLAAAICCGMSLLIIINGGTALAQAKSGAGGTAGEHGDAAAGAQSDALKAKVGEWLKQAFDVMADPDIRHKLPAEVDRVLSEGDNIRLVLDAKVTRERMSKCVITWAGQMHEFNLTAAQTRAAGVSPGGATLGSIGRSGTDSPLTPLPYRLEQVRIDEPDKIMGNKPVTGSVVCKSALGGELASLPGQLILRTMYRTERGQRWSIRFLDSLPADGVLKFRIDAVNDKPEDVQFGPVPLLIDLVLTSPTIGEGVLASACAGVVLDVLPDPEGYMKAGMQFFRDLAVLAESVVDEPSAAAALPKFRELSLKNKSLLEVLERLGPIDPALDAELSKKYNPMMEEWAAKMQSQMMRLEQAPYAGEAYLDKVGEAMKVM